MGGRIALRSSHPKILLSTHPGLQTSQEKAQRLQQDQHWIQKLEQEPLDQFLQSWYAQPLFDSLRNHPHFPKILSRRGQQDPQMLIQMLKKESLSNQAFSMPSQTHFLHGQFDEKYKRLYQEQNIPSLEISQAGHAAHLENPKGCAEAILQAIEALFAKSCNSCSG
jgi:2-succinyl-6-hydroxy-2,4-cyclohexadiene-1-carboxylate synthase